MTQISSGLTGLPVPGWPAHPGAAGLARPRLQAPGRADRDELPGAKGHEFFQHRRQGGRADSQPAGHRDGACPLASEPQRFLRGGIPSGRLHTACLEFIEQGLLVRITASGATTESSAVRPAATSAGEEIASCSCLPSKFG